jgi:divalent metal cation (Fe/Co/Zn/Cd) transporter
MSNPSAGAAGTAGTNSDWRGPSKDELRNGFSRMLQLEWTTLIYQIIVTAILIYFAGGSQAMKTEWVENLFTIVPVAGVLLTYGTENKPQDARRPFGYHRTATIAFAAASFALAGVGTFLCFEASSNLLRGERPSIGGITIFGQTVWLGWIMIGLMLTTAIPQIVLGKMKTPVAKLIHDKALHADAEMNRANWMTNGAGAIGLMLVAFGYWWGDSLAALLISLDIMRDGYTSVARSLSDVMDHHPTEIESDKQDPLVTDIHRTLKKLPFVENQTVLIREHGRYIYAEIFIQPNDWMLSVLEATRQVREAIMPLDWRLQHLAIEFTDDIKSASSVLTRKEIDIEG